MTLNLGAQRFAGNITLATSASDIFCHVREMLEVAAGIKYLKTSFANSAAPHDLVLEVTLDAVASGLYGDRVKGLETFVAEPEVEGEAGKSQLQKPRGDSLLANPLLPFANRVKVELQAEKGSYKRFVDILVDFTNARTSNIRTLVAVFEVLFHRRPLLDQFCNLVLSMPRLPDVLLISKAAHLRKFCKHVLPQAESHPAETGSVKTPIYATDYVVNALPVFDPNGVHAIPVSMVSRMKKPNLFVKTTSNSTATRSRNNAALNSGGILDGFGSVIPVPRPRKDSLASCSASGPNSSCSSTESITGMEIPQLQRVTRRTVRLGSIATTASTSTSASDAVSSHPPTHIKRPSSIPLPTINYSPKRIRSLPNPVSASTPLTFSQIPKKANPKHKQNTSMETSKLSPLVKRDATISAPATPNAHLLFAVETFDTNAKLPTVPQNEDVPATKESAKHIDYIMNALLNHQSAGPFRADNFKKPKSGLSSGTVSPISNASIITTSASTASLPQSASSEKQITSVPLFNLTTMSHRLKGGQYLSPQLFRRDFEGIIAHCREKNAFLRDRLSQYTGTQSIEAIMGHLEQELTAAEKLEKYFMNEWAYFFPEISGKRRRGTTGGGSGTESPVDGGSGYSPVSAKIVAEKVSNVKRSRRS